MTEGRAPDVPLDEIEWRIDGEIDGGGGVRVVCYLDVPIVTRLLDEWVGPWRWSDTYEATNNAGVMWCYLALADDDGAWVTKRDLGTASAFEAEKGLVSDAFKRVAMRKWRVGANVFDLPVLRLPQGRFRTYQSRGGQKAALNDDSLTWIAGELRRLGHDDAAKAAESTPVGSQDEPAPDPVDLAELETAVAEAQARGIDVDADKARAHASQSVAHRDASVKALSDRIAALDNGQAESEEATT